jgi:hypothetical protein
MAVMILDNCPFHGIERFPALCGERNVFSLFRPQYSSNQLQPLDLSLFGLTKRLLIRFNHMDASNTQTQHTAQVVSAYLSAPGLFNVIEVFARRALT